MTTNRHKTAEITEHAEPVLSGKLLGTEHDMRECITEMCLQAGSQSNLAERLGVSTAYLGDILHGRRPVSERMAEKLGWKRVVVFVWPGNDGDARG